MTYGNSSRAVRPVGRPRQIRAPRVVGVALETDVVDVIDRIAHNRGARRSSVLRELILRTLARDYCFKGATR